MRMLGRPARVTSVLRRNLWTSARVLGQEKQGVCGDQDCTKRAEVSGCCHDRGVPPPEQQPIYYRSIQHIHSMRQGAEPVDSRSAFELMIQLQQASCHQLPAAWPEFTADSSTAGVYQILPYVCGMQGLRQDVVMCAPGSLAMCTAAEAVGVESERWGRCWGGTHAQCCAGSAESQ